MNQFRIGLFAASVLLAGLTVSESIAQSTRPDRAVFMRTARWAGGNPRFTSDQVVEFSRNVVAAGGVITWNVSTRNDGTLAPDFLEQLSAIGKAIREVPTTQGQ